MILVREQKDATWYSGQLNGKVGWFPRSYVRPATEVEIQNNKNTVKNTPTTPSSANAFTPSNGISSNGGSQGDVYVSIYPYEATDPGDLSFDVNERITVLERDGNWWTGKIGNRVGTFPNNYVQKVDNGANQPIQVGWFPARCVELQNASSPSTPTTTYQNTQEYPRYVANFAYEAQQDDELSFPADAILEILDQGGSTGWFKARYNNQTGLVPSTYVKPMEESTP